MNKISIAIIIICTAIIAVVVFFSLKEEAGIEDIYLVSSINIEEESLEDTGAREFSSTSSTIYVLIPVTGVEAGDQIKVAWVFLGKDGNKIIQTDDIEVEDEGSGTIAAYLLKADSVYKPGEYKVKVDYNGLMEKEASFTITESLY
jgi:hypothetical protein